MYKIWYLVWIWKRSTPMKQLPAAWVVSSPLTICLELSMLLRRTRFPWLPGSTVPRQRETPAGAPLPPRQPPQQQLSGREKIG